MIAARGLTTWRHFAGLFLGVFAGGLGGVALFVLLVDPYGVVPFSLPIERPIVSISQRHLYPQAMRSGGFDSVIIGTSTSRLLDPETLNGPFEARFFNAAMNNAMAWEQKLIFDKFVDKVTAPKAVIVGLDSVWCRGDAAEHRFGYPDFPHWMYDHEPWNDVLHLLNAGTVETAARVVRWHLGLYRARIRHDGFDVFVPPESEYDATRASYNIWHDNGQPRRRVHEGAPAALSDAQRHALKLPAVEWLGQMLGRLPASTRKILAFMPTHVAGQPLDGSMGKLIETECKRRIAEVARSYGAHLVDWRIPSPLTREDANYWDAEHYRLPIAQRIARDLARAVLEGREAPDGSYRLSRP